MQFFYVKQPCTLALPQKQAELQSPSPEALGTLQIPLQNLYCGNVGWEITHARMLLGDEAVVVQPLTPEIEALLPLRLGPFSSQGDLLAQLRTKIGPPGKAPQPLRLALINGFGTMLGDNLVGARALEIAVEHLRGVFGAVEIHAVLAWNARPGADGILSRSPVVTSMQTRSITLEALRQFDACWDFSSLLRMSGYDILPLIDFYLEHLGLDAALVPAAEKLPVLRLPDDVRAESRLLFSKIRKGRKLILLQGKASTGLRSMPEPFFTRLLDDLLRETNAAIVLTQPLPGNVVAIEDKRVLHIEEWCASRTENFLSVFNEVDAVISVDTVALHAAAAARKPGVAVFAATSPELRVPAGACISGVVVPGAEGLPLWGKHKEDASWAEHQPAYEAAWLALDRSALIRQLAQALASPATAAIYFHPEAYTTAGPRLMGRNAAGESFLRGFCAHSGGGEFWVHVNSIAHAQPFVNAVASAGRGEPIKVIERASLAALSQPGALYFPGPDIGKLAWQRASLGGVAGHGAWSLCGITHTTASVGAMDALADLLVPPVQPWDALICTSHAVKSNVLALLQAQADYLAQRFDARQMVLPQLPVIPLGIHTQDFSFDDQQRRAARAAIGAGERTLVVLYTGRLSFHAKAHPLAMYRAIQAAAARLAPQQEVLLVECGWFANDYIGAAYQDAARSACPSVRVVTLDGRKSEHRQTAWASADVFCSLADNIQETFGITPVEAMAAGLPVVVSDWDGYKDTVRHGIDGFRVPTLMPGAGLGIDLAQRHALELDSYDMYCGYTSALVAVDIASAEEAFYRLFTSPDLRRQMGEAGRQRAREVFDWAAIIPQYEMLWAQLAELRSTQGPHKAALPHPWPARLDPFYAFSTYPTAVLSLQTVLGLIDPDAETAVQRLACCRRLAMVSVAETVLPTDSEALAILHAAESGARTAAELLNAVSPARQAHVFRGLAGLIKLGVLRVF